MAAFNLFGDMAAIFNLIISNSQGANTYLFNVILFTGRTLALPNIILTITLTLYLLFPLFILTLFINALVTIHILQYDHTYEITVGLLTISEKGVIDKNKIFR